jgi:diacylglycerol O-acyltransferase / wax synthase
MPTVDRLTMREAGYLHLERRGVPCTIGWAAQVDHPPGAPEEYVRSITALLASRLHQLPRLRQRVVAVPRGCGMPVWVDDERFAVARHVRLVAKTEPAGGLAAVAEELFARPLDLHRPLWDLWVVEGVSEGRLTIVFRLHHAIADGVGAATIAAVLLAGTGEGAPALGWQPAPPPSTAALLRDNLRWRLATVHHALRLAAHPLQRLRRGAEMIGQLRGLWHQARGARPTSLNASLGRRRTLSVVEVALADVRAAGRRHGATVNDVLLTAVAGGFSALLRSRREVIGRDLHAAQGVSRRAAGDSGVGNQTGGMVVPLHAGNADPVDRLRRIAGETRARKASSDAPALVSLQDSPFVPVAVQSLLERKMRTQKLVQTYVANVPGPPEVLDLAGAALRTIVPVVPLMANVPLVVAAVSYAGRYVIGVRTDSDAAPDVAVFMAGLRETLAALGVVGSDAPIRTSAGPPA